MLYHMYLTNKNENGRADHVGVVKVKFKVSLCRFIRRPYDISFCKILERVYD